MLDLIYIAVIYLLAIIGILSLLAALFVLYICYRYDINININNQGKNRPVEIKKKDDGIPQKTP